MPANAWTDGASIPPLLWPLVGHPFKSDYLKAAVVHDWYCAVRTERWQDTHDMFYWAMLTNGISAKKARMMFAGVYYLGPSWDELTIKNARLLTNNGQLVLPRPAPIYPPPPAPPPPAPMREPPPPEPVREMFDSDVSYLLAQQEWEQHMLAIKTVQAAEEKAAAEEAAEREVQRKQYIEGRQKLIDQVQEFGAKADKDGLTADQIRSMIERNGRAETQASNYW